MRPLRPYRIRRNRRSLRTLDPALYLPAPAHVLAVSAHYDDDFAIFITDEPLAIESGGGAAWDVFRLQDNVQMLLTGTAGVLLDPYRLKITLDGPIQNTGAAWNWEINPEPDVAMIHTVEGENLEAGSGAVVIE